MTDGLDGARLLLPDVRLEAVDRLAGSDRSDVQRVRMTRPGNDPELVVVKSFSASGEGWVRETAALSVLPDEAPVARLLHAGAEPPVAVCTDLGDGPTLADALLGEDWHAAVDALRGWADALAALHRSTRELREPFQRALDQRAGDLPVSAHVIGVEMANLAHTLDQRLPAMGVATTRAALDELRGLGQRLGPDGPAALTPADACPDNNVLVGDRVRLLDFEGAQWRHVAWDLAYLRVPWPTCWCSWRIPDEVADEALARYRARSGIEVSDADITAATAAWAFVGVDWFLDLALGDDPELNPGRPTPTRRAMLLHRLAVAAAQDELPAVAELAERLRADLAARWGEVELAFAVAFQS